MSTLTSCSSSDEDRTGAIAVGENGAVGSVNLLGVLLVAAAEGEPARLLGTLENESDQSVEVTITDDDDEVVITVEPDEQLSLLHNETIIDTADDAPGANTTITVATSDDTTDLLVPVLDGTLDQYRPYVPE
ncbi:hypothetical protein E8P82_11960 [Arthrobacter echini]|uniref:Uncharacterized protein n=1 Tax=Arthrobacter echini TaxID=1529066 RepID=A0A4S5E2A2_9MICC|nr:hypothetical protein [Arthrobacter echini]THJ65463.1 hypothetical protein E8P82_11960 [Arthrobacter echini]